MYCRMCGNKIGDQDHYCQNCGTPTGVAEFPDVAADKREIKEEVVFNPPYENASHFPKDDQEPESKPPQEAPQMEPVPKEELKGFISENEIEAAHQEADSKNQTELAGPATTERKNEFSWNVHEFPASKKKTEDATFNWNMEEFGPQEQKQLDPAVIEEVLFREMKADTSRIKEQNIDRFFTFNRKNEEFQELLDREYERVKLRPEPELEPLPDLKLHIPTAESELPNAAEAELPKTTELADIHEIPEEALHSEETMDPEVPDALLDSPAELEIPETMAVRETPEVPATSPKAEHLSEMVQARAQFFGEDLIQDNESIRKKLTADTQQTQASEAGRTQISEAESTQAKRPEAPRIVKLDMESVSDAVKADSAAVLTGEKPQVQDAPAVSKDDIESQEAAQEAATEENREAAQATEAARDDHDQAHAAFAAVSDVEQEDTERRGISGGQIALIIIALILAAEIGILGIRYFAPESAVNKSIEKTQSRVINTVTGWFRGADTKTDEVNQEKDQTGQEQNTATDSALQEQTSTAPAVTETDAAVADPNPMTDKDALIASQTGNNKNIEQIKSNPALAWQQGKNYGSSDINSSLPITNNIWQAPETGEPLYYDKSIVGTIIAFDSQWIDYVNNKDKAVLDLLKKDSAAYKNTLAYKKAGKIKETFKLLEIGEIRQGSSGYYVWVHEEIQITENGATTNKKYNWIYCLEPADGKMKIVNYLKF